MNPLNWNAEEVKAQIGNLLHTYPELAEDEILRADMFEGETDLHKVLSRVERDRQEATAMAAAINLWIDELEARAARYDRRNDAMRKLLFNLLQAANLRKVELPEATLSIRDGQAKTIITDEASLPDAFVRIKREPDKMKIKEALQDGTQVPGAMLSNIEPVLSIRTK